MKMKKFSAIKNKIREYAENKGVSIREIYSKTGMSDGTLSNNSGLSEENILKFISAFPDVSTDWLLSIKEDDNIVSEIPSNAIPFYNLPVSAGHTIDEVKGKLSPDGYIKDLPGASTTEALLPVRGYSMQPEIKEGAIIGVKQVQGWDFLNTQHKYLIITHEDRMVKYIEHDENHEDILWCLSPNYAKFKVLKADIIEVHRITFVINPE